MSHEYNLRSTGTQEQDTNIPSDNMDDINPDPQSPESQVSQYEFDDSLGATDQTVISVDLEQIHPDRPTRLHDEHTPHSETPTLEHSDTPENSTLDQILRALSNLQFATNAQSTLQAEQHHALSSQLTLQSEKLDKQSQELNARLEKQEERLSNMSSEIRTTVLNELQQFKTEVHQETKLLLAKSEQTVADQLKKFQELNALTLNNMQETLAHMCTEQTNTLFAEQTVEIQQKIDCINNTQTAQTQEVRQLQCHLTKTNTHLAESVSKIENKIDDISGQVNDLSQVATQLSSKVNHLETLGTGTCSPPEITVYCEGHNTQSDITYPTFNPRSENPQIFLEGFEKYWKLLNARKHQSAPAIVDVLHYCLKGEALAWLQIHQDRITCLATLKELFSNRLWSLEVQNQVKRRIESTKYNSVGRKTRSELFLSMVAELRTLSAPSLSESQIVTTLSELFGEEISLSAKVLGINTIDTFETLLLRFDRSETIKRTENAKETKVTQNNDHVSYANNRGKRQRQYSYENVQSQPERTGYNWYASNRRDHYNTATVPRSAAAIMETPTHNVHTTTSDVAAAAHSSDRRVTSPPQWNDTASVPVPHSSQAAHNYQPYHKKGYAYNKPYKQEINYLDTGKDKTYYQRPAKQGYKYFKYTRRNKYEYPTAEQARVTHEIAVSRSASPSPQPDNPEDISLNGQGPFRCQSQ